MLGSSCHDVDNCENEDNCSPFNSLSLSWHLTAQMCTDVEKCHIIITAMSSE